MFISKKLYIYANKYKTHIEYEMYFDVSFV